MITAATISEALGGKPYENGFKCLCPAHDDINPSLTVTERNGKILVKCFAGCGQKQVINALKDRHLWPSGNGDGKPKSNITNFYDYQDPTGKLAYQVCRTDTKEFPQRRPDPAAPGKWIWGIKGVTRYPYHLPQVLKADIVYIAEGEKDVDRLAAMGFTATCNSGGAGNWQREINQYFQGRAVVIFPDNDGKGRAHALNVAQNLHGIASSIKVVDLPSLPDKGDVSDWISAGGTRAGLLNIVEQSPEYQPKAQDCANGKTTLKTITARDLGMKIFDPPRWAIPNVIPEGLTILAGPPKIGKSIFCLDLGVSTATGGKALGNIQVEEGEALYLALEDSERRLKERLEKIIPFGDLPGTLHFLTARDFPPLHRGGLDGLDAWLNDHPEARLVIIDTFIRVKPPKGKNADAYEHDSQVMASLQGLSNLYKIALIVVTHTKKGKEDDFLANILGSTGQTGIADCVAELTRKARGQMDGILKLSGRDIEEQELAMRFVPDLMMWELLGEASEFNKSIERQELMQILSNESLTAVKLAETTGKSISSIRKILYRMKEKGEIRLDDKNRYSVS